MKMILLENIKNLGKIGQQVNVKAGYARNYLIPQKKATLLNAENLAFFEKERVKIEQKAKVIYEKSLEIKEKIENSKFEITSKTKENGELFGSISSVNILNELANLNLNYKIEKKNIHIKEDKIKSIGKWEVDIVLHSEVTAKIILVVKESK